MSAKRFLYYHLKPYLPWRLRMAVRRPVARRKLRTCGDVWPINEAAGQPPANWPGWPEGKKFAFVLTHDVEGTTGLVKCRQLMQLEQELGFRSSFNFVPEGEYRVSPALRGELVENGFEVGIHDLRHDGKLYWNESIKENARRINGYVKEWRAQGFRSAFMLHNPESLHALDIQYDASTFDTDPFEPQPDGVHTIFPFWVPRSGRGYVELPYTLPQDSTLFLLLREKSNEIWERKLAWIVKHGGMVLVNVHPDYMCFQNRAAESREYPAHLYKQFLNTVKSKYAGQFWHALPREVAAFVKQHKEVLHLRRTVHNSTCCRDILPQPRKIWIDLENTPHIPFFKPIIRELENRGYTVLLTARDAFQTCEMANRYGFPYLKIGRHYGQNRILKVGGLLMRSLQLLPFALREKPALALSHGSRAQILACNLLRIPSILIMDYEHTISPPMVRPWWEIVPEVVSLEARHCNRADRIRKFSGIKEDVYVPDFKPDPAIIKQLQLNADIIVTVRPPATEAHYHNPEAEVLFACFMERICATSGVKAVLLPRNKAQHVQITTAHPDWFKDSKVIIPNDVVDGLNLLWHSDLAVSGGGTMNREAAALGVPVYSLFRGKIGAVDRSLQTQGRLTFIENREDVGKKILLIRRTKLAETHVTQRQALHDIIAHVEAIAQLYPPE